MRAPQNVRKDKAVVLGGLAGSAVFGFGLFFAGAAWFVTAGLVIDDHRTSDPARHTPTALFALGLLASALLGARCGLKVGRDWYRNGR